ncbi:MAG TPA: prepilin peptidase [bacterium]|nr:prepilin peptidase [bacterium]
MSEFPSLPGAPAVLIAPFVAILGALVGSFLNVVILRVPERRSIVHPPSHCPKCQAPIRWFDNIPVLSWLLLRGKCRSCRAPISARYPAVEALTSLLFVAVVWKFGLQLHTAAYLAFTATMVALTFIDLDHRIIPNVISVPGIAAGVALAFVLPHSDGAWLPVGWKASLLGVVVGGGSLLVTALAYEFVARREGMGMGDVKMLAMIGAFLGIGAVPFVFMASALLGSVVGIVLMVVTGAGRKAAIPFGPFLAVAAIAYLFVGPEVMTAYMRRALPPPSSQADAVSVPPSWGATR